jgi:hypothetical protein
MKTATTPPRMIPPHNLFGDHGPLCPHCSGLGAVLRLPSDGRPTRSTSRCTCGGTGVDHDLVMRNQISALVNKMARMEKATMRQARLIRDLRSQTSLTGKMSRQMWEELIAWATADGTAVHTTTSETIIMPNVTIPGNYMQDGRKLRLRVSGKYSTLGSGTVTHVFRVRWGGVGGGTLLAATGTVTLLISMANAFWEFMVELQTRANGATGTILADGVCKVFGGTAPTIGSATGAPAVAPMTAGGQTAPAAVTVDLTADVALAVTIQHGASSASNTATGMQYALESRN